MSAACRFQSDANNYNETFNACAEDFLLYGRGVGRVFYEPVTTTVEDADDVDGLDEESMRGPQAEAAEERKDADEAGNPQEVLDFENVKFRYVQRQDFVHQPARTWEECQWVAFRAFLAKDELIERFGEEIGSAIPLDAAPDRPDGSEKSPGQSSLTDKATIWEMWDREKQKVRWIAKGYPDVLEEGDPYLKRGRVLSVPGQRAFGTVTNDKPRSCSDYVDYQDQVEEIGKPDGAHCRVATVVEPGRLPLCRTGPARCRVA